ncbi:MAG: DNA topoisomerase IB [Acidobacteria bacterium]|nr:DNA topoisomerase IB [Acidobacteriota bacterium]
MVTAQADTGPGAEAEKAAGSVLARGARARWLRRRGSKSRGFWYEDARGRRVGEAALLERIKSLAVPPAWREVRIAPGPCARVQAIGLDGAGRVQRVYHAAFSAARQRRKYEKIERFGEALAALRRRTNEDIAREGLPKERVLAVVVRLINDLYFRVGSEESVRRYRTYGVTTLRNQHLEIKRGGRLVFQFTGKHHVDHRLVLVDDELAALLGDIQALRGRRLFQYWDEERKRPRPVTPRDVNDYIKSATSAEFSAKDFRTWGGTLLAAVSLAEAGKPENERQANRNLVRALRTVSERLGNTPVVCRTSYVHPAVFESYCAGVTLEEFRPRRERRVARQQPDYLPEERALLKLLRARGDNP